MRILISAWVIAALMPVARADVLALTGATVYDGTGAAAIEGATVVVRDGRIDCVGASCPIPDGAETIPLEGRFVTPGLVDAHVHFVQTGWVEARPDSGVGLNVYGDGTIRAERDESNPESWHNEYLCSGITAVFDVGGNPATLALQALAKGDPRRVHVAAAGRMLIDVPEASGGFEPIRGDVAAFVDAQAEAGSSAIKVFVLTTPDDAIRAALRTTAERAHGHGIPMVAHATELEAARAAVEAGADVLVHSVREPVDDAFVALARESDLIYIPTLQVYANWRRAGLSVAMGRAPTVDDPNGCVDPVTYEALADVETLDLDFPEAWQDPAYHADALIATGRTRQVEFENLVRLHAAGVRIATGTDAGNALTLHGPSILAEMEWMAQAGMSPGEILVASTRNGALAMGRSEDIGTLEPGKVADLLVLEDDPGASASAFRGLTHVMRAGDLQPIAAFRPVADEG